MEIEDGGASGWGTSQRMNENVCLIGENSLNLVFLNVFPRDFDSLRNLIYILYLG